jgi:predicted 3-demethylubiquinone-9 3-methyltransferase (glyoxalase superfamily)
MADLQKITPCLWFDSEAEEAARFYVSVFRNARVGKISRYGKEGFEIHGRPEGSVMTVEFEIEGQSFTALNGGPHFKFNRGDLIPDSVRDAGGGRPLLGETLRWWRGPAMRLAQG